MQALHPRCSSIPEGGLSWMAAAMTLSILTLVALCFIHSNLPETIGCTLEESTQRESFVSGLSGSFRSSMPSRQALVSESLNDVRAESAVEMPRSLHSSSSSIDDVWGYRAAVCSRTVFSQAGRSPSVLSSVYSPHVSSMRGTDSPHVSSMRGSSLNAAYMTPVASPDGQLIQRDSLLDEGVTTHPLNLCRQITDNSLIN